jgi:dedicator of cytokinesis protein 3
LSNQYPIYYSLDSPSSREKKLYTCESWESAIEICKELQAQYEHRSFNYERLAELLVHEAELYASIVKQDRYFSEYFRVAFYGSKFPLSVQNKQFIYRGLEWEKYPAFCERLLNKHPNAQLLRTNTLPTEEIQFADAQYIQITSVVAEPDRTSPIFTNPEVPVAIRSYYEHNATNTFSFTRPVRKESRALTRVVNDFINLWTEKTILICEDAFPTVLRRSEIVEVRIIELSPIENALQAVETTTQELQSLEHRYSALSKTSGGKINTNVLSMALNSAVDAPANGGIPMYRRGMYDRYALLLSSDFSIFIQHFSVLIILVQTLTKPTS